MQIVVLLLNFENSVRMIKKNLLLFVSVIRDKF